MSVKRGQVSFETILLVGLVSVFLLILLFVFTDFGQAFRRSSIDASAQNLVTTMTGTMESGTETVNVVNLDFPLTIDAVEYQRGDLRFYSTLDDTESYHYALSIPLVGEIPLRGTLYVEFLQDNYEGYVCTYTSGRRQDCCVDFKCEFDTRECFVTDGVVTHQDTNCNGLPDWYDSDISGDGMPNRFKEYYGLDPYERDEPPDEYCWHPNFVFGETCGSPASGGLVPCEGGDGIPDWMQHDLDCDGIPDWLDYDIDGDGIPNWFDSHSFDETQGNTSWNDAASNGMPHWRNSDWLINNPDTEGHPWIDYDGDGIPRMFDSDPLDPNVGNEDFSGDGIPSWLQIDSSGNGVPDWQDVDWTGNKVPYYLDPNWHHYDTGNEMNWVVRESDGKLVPRYYYDGASVVERTVGYSHHDVPDWVLFDSNGNGLPDWYDIDWNNNGIPNEFDACPRCLGSNTGVDYISADGSPGSDGIDDWLQYDTSGNGFPDWYMLSTSGSGVPDMFSPSRYSSLFGGEDVHPLRPGQTPDGVAWWLTEDTDGDGFYDWYDYDIDGDGIPNAFDPIPFSQLSASTPAGAHIHANWTSLRTIPDNPIPDYLNDNRNGNNLPDAFDPHPQNASVASPGSAIEAIILSFDIDGDGIPDINDTDIDGDGQRNECDPNPQDSSIHLDGCPAPQHYEVDSCGIISTPGIYSIANSLNAGSLLYCLVITADNVWIMGNNHVISNGGIYASETNNTIIRNVHIQDAEENGIVLDESQNSIIIHSLISNPVESGVYSTENSLSAGIYESSIVGGTNGIFLENSENSVIISLDVASANMCGLRLLDALNTDISESDFYNNHRGICIEADTQNTLLLNNQIYANTVSGIHDLTATNRFNFLRYQNIHGQIDWIGTYPEDMSFAGDLTYGEGRNVSINHNNAKIRLEDFTGNILGPLNITLHNYPAGHIYHGGINPLSEYQDVRIRRDDVVCYTPDCFNLTPFHYETVVFNTSTFGAYRLGSICDYYIDSCDVPWVPWSFYCGNVSISAIPGTCLDVTASNVQIDGRGYELSGIGLGYGIHSYGQSAVTVGNFSFTSFRAGVMFNTTTNNVISNLAISTSTLTDIYLFNTTTTRARRSVDFPE